MRKIRGGASELSGFPPPYFFCVTRLAFEVGEGELRGFIRGEEDGKRREEKS